MTVDASMAQEIVCVRFTYSRRNSATCSCFVFFFSSRRRHTRYWRDWSSDVCSSDLESLFQLGVLSFEQGRPKEAEAFMKRRLALAETSGDPDWIADAKEDLETLYEKIGRASCRERV